jgi:hypothetical protein
VEGFGLADVPENRGDGLEALLLRDRGEDPVHDGRLVVLALGRGL